MAGTVPLRYGLRWRSPIRGQLGIIAAFADA